MHNDDDKLAAYERWILLLVAIIVVGSALFLAREVFHLF
jgi:hypothetical protein